MIDRDIEEQDIGQVVLIYGNLNIVDLPFLKNVWDVPAARKDILKKCHPELSFAENGFSSKTASGKQALNTSKSNPIKRTEEDITSLIEILDLISQTLQAHMGNDRGLTTWANLKQDSLAVSPHDLVLKHGAEISGRWSMLGILDAIPEKKDDTPTNSLPFHQLAHSPFARLLASITPMARRYLGRPPSAYGLTPLMIFRKVSTRVS